MTELPSNMMNIQQQNNVYNQGNASMGINSGRQTLNAFGLSPGFKPAGT